MSTPSDIRDGIADAFAALRDEFFPDNPTVTLLQQSESVDDYDELLIIDKWFLEYSDFRKNWALQIADDSSELTDAIQAATHVSVGADIYVIAKADTTPPQGTDVLWSLYCTRYFNRAQYAGLY